MPTPVRRVLLLALAGGVLFDAVVPGNAAGVNAPLVMAAFLGAALLAAGRPGIDRMDRADAWLAPAALAFSVFPVLRSDDWLVSLDLLLAAVLAVGFIGCLAGGRVTRGLVPRVLELSVGAMVAAVTGVVMVLADGRRAHRLSLAADADGAATSGWRRRLGRAAPVVRGLLIALPVAAVFVVLFAAADAVFARLASGLLSWRLDLDLGDVVARTVVITVVAWGAAGLLGLGGGLLPGLASSDSGAAATTASAHGAGPAGPNVATADVPEDGSPGDPAPHDGATGTTPADAPPPPPRGPGGPGYAGVPRPSWAPAVAASAGHAAATWQPTPAPWAAPGAGWNAQQAPLTTPRLGATEAATILVVVDLLFAVFVGLQLAYLFGGRDTLAMAGMTYSDYARRGFFELVLVAGLAGFLVVVLDLAVAGRTRAQLGAAGLLLALTAAVLVSAFLRLRLYQEAYGWTELRLVVLTAIGWLAVALGVTGWLLATGRTRWVLHALGILSLVTMGGLNLVGPQRTVTGQNLARAVDPSLVPPGGRTGLDAGYLYELGDEAVVPVVEAWPRLDPGTRAALEPVLEDRREMLSTAPSLQGWPAWTLTREQARSALRDWIATQGR
jgi:hypothetical protein